MLITCIMCLYCGQDSESDNDYESPEQEEDDDRYICALAEAQTVEQQDSEESFDGNYRPLDSAETMKPPRPPRASKLQGSHSRGNRGHNKKKCSHMKKHLSVSTAVLFICLSFLTYSLCVNHT